MGFPFTFPRNLCAAFLVALIAGLSLGAASVAYADGPDGTGPGGVGSTDGSSSLVLWLKGDAGVSTSGAKVIGWSDQSGNGNSAFGVGATYLSDRINGQPAIGFDGSEVYSVSGLNIANPYTIFTVSRQDGSTRQRLISSGSVNWLLGYHNGQEDQFYAEGWIHNPVTPVTSDTIMYAATGDGTSSALYRDGQQVARNDGGTAAPGILQLGGTTAEASDGTVAEVIVFDSVLNTAQRALVENYLSAKYGVPLSAGDRYAGDTSENGDYDLDVAGIGRESDGSHAQARAAGLVLMGAPFLVDDGDYVLAGHRTPRSGISSADLPEGVSQRWARVWYVDRTDGGSSTNGNLTLAFDFSEGKVGGTPVDAGNYRLLFRGDGSGPLSVVTVASTSVVDDQVVFEVSDPNLQDGYYTLGTIDASSSPLSGTQLILTKAVDDEYPIPGQRITYVLAVENSGLADATDVLVSDTLPGGLTFAGPVTLEGSRGTVADRASDLPTLASGLTIAAGGRVTVTLPVTVNVGLANDRIITNTAAVSCAEMPVLQQGSKRVRVTEVVGVVFINEILAANTSTNRDPDYVFSDWIEVYNSGSRAIDLGGLYLTDDLADATKWQIPAGTIVEPKGFKLFWADGTDRADEANDAYHTNFKLGQAGEEVGLFGPAGILVDSLVYDPQISDVSLGRKPDGAPAWFFFAEPTPDRTNDTDGCRELVTAPLPEFSLPGGFYRGIQAIELSVSAPSAAVSATIRYTLDGSTPTSASAVYTSPIDVRATTVVRARTFETGCLPSATIGHTYFIDEAHTLPVVSISTDPDNLWALETGIYARHWVDLENRVSLEFYEADGDLGFSLDAGARIFGGHARNMPQKALAILARNKYGAGGIDYQIFGDKPLDRFKTFVLRNSGNDWRSTMLRDALTPALIRGRMDVDYLAYRPAIVYLNGEYWGIHNIREKINEHYIASNYGIDPAKVDLLHTYVRYAEGRMALAGDVEHYDNLTGFLESHDMALPQNYEYVKTQVDVEEFLDYLIAEMYIANSDWLLNNNRYWRPKTEDGRWRWILYDTDVAFGLDVSIYGWGHRDYTYDMIQYAIQDKRESLLIRKLFENTEFRNEFIQRFASHLNTTFLPERVIGIIDRLKANIEPEMPGHIARWREHCGGHEHLECGIQSMDAWETDINVMRDFAAQRPAYVRQHIIDKFGLSGTVTLTVNTSGSGAGRVLINGVVLPESGFSGIYFRDVPLRLTAVPSASCRFAGWQGIPGGGADSISITLTEALAITATFETGSPGLRTSEAETQDGARRRSGDTEVASIVINEIHYNPFSLQDSGDDYEFIELCNVGEATIDLSGYAFAEGIEFTFPQGSIISPGEYVLVARYAGAYSGQGYQVFQWASGGLRNSGEGIRLADAAGREVDTVNYGAAGDDGALWPEEPDGDGPSLALIEPSRDNSLPGNWRASTVVGGTPGQSNLESRAITTGGVRYRSSRSQAGDLFFGVSQDWHFATMPDDRVYLRLVMRSFP